MPWQITADSPSRHWALATPPACIPVSPWKCHCVCTQATLVRTSFATFSLGGNCSTDQRSCPPSPRGLSWPSVFPERTSGTAPGRVAPLISPSCFCLAPWLPSGETLLHWTPFFHQGLWESRAQAFVTTGLVSLLGQCGTCGT